MFCPMCGAPNEDDATFCANCGAALAAAAQPPAPAAGAPAVTTPPESPAETVGAAAPEQPPMTAAPEPAPAEEPVTTPGPAPVQEVVTTPPPPARPAGPSRMSAVLQTSSLAIASLILGIGGLTFLPLLGSIAAVILGYMARTDIRSRPSELTGEGTATAGLVLGWIGVGLAALGLICGGGLIALCALANAMGR